MYNVMDRKWLYFLISGILIIPGTISLILWGLRPSIDFTGGTLMEVQSSKFIPIKSGQSSGDDIKKILTDEKIELSSMTQSGEESLLLRLKHLEKEQHDKLLEELKKKFEDVNEIRYEAVGPSVGRETTENAIKGVVIASLAIIIYIGLAFREIPKPYSSFKFGICAVAALIHDVLLVIGIFSLFGHFWKVEIDSLFITALLTVMGFSVHDTIVVFDRIRENLRKMPGRSFKDVVNESIVQTLARSLSTSLTVIFTLVALLLFGGETIRWFIVALLIGIISGTYSSIFNAAPLLVVWENFGNKRKV